MGVTGGRERDGVKQWCHKPDLANVMMATYRGLLRLQISHTLHFNVCIVQRFEYWVQEFKHLSLEKKTLI